MNWRLRPLLEAASRAGCEPRRFETAVWPGPVCLIRKRWGGRLSLPLISSGAESLFFLGGVPQRRAMRKILLYLLDCVIRNFRSRAALQLEIIVLGQQLFGCSKPCVSGPLVRSRRRHGANSAGDPPMEVKPIRRISPDQLNGRDSLHHRYERLAA